MPPEARMVLLPKQGWNRANCLTGSNWHPWGPEKPAWMSINPDTGLIAGTSDGTGGTVIVGVTLTKEHRLVHDENAIVWGNEWEKSKTYETLGPVTQQFVVQGAE